MNSAQPQHSPARYTSSARPHAPTLALVLTTLIWGSTFTITKDVLDVWTPLAYLAARFLLAALALLLLFPTSLRSLGKDERRAGLVLGLLIGCGMLLQAAGQVHTTATRSAFLTSLTTPLVPLLALVLLRSRPSRQSLAGIAIAFVGGMLMLFARSDSENGVGEAASSDMVNPGDLLTLCCTIFFAAHITLMERYTRRFEVRRLTVLQIGSAALVLAIAWACVRLALCVWAAEAVPAFVLREAGAPPWSGVFVWQLTYLTLVGTVAAFLLWTWGQRRVSAVRAAIIFTLEPVFALLFAVAARGEAELLRGLAAIGALLIVLGVLVSEIRFKQKD